MFGDNSYIITTIDVLCMTLLLTQMLIFKLRRKTAKPPVTREETVIGSMNT